MPSKLWRRWLWRIKGRELRTLGHRTMIRRSRSVPHRPWLDSSMEHSANSSYTTWLNLWSHIISPRYRSGISSKRLAIGLREPRASWIQEWNRNKNQHCIIEFSHAQTLTMSYSSIRLPSAVFFQSSLRNAVESPLFTHAI